MLYTSFNPSLDSALIGVYGSEAQTIAVGSTTGPASDPHFARLNWEEFSRDLMVANHFSHVIGVYNFGGCVRQGFLARLKNLNWSESVTISAESVQRATKLRERIQRVLWIVSNLPYFVAVIPIASFGQLCGGRNVAFAGIRRVASSSRDAAAVVLFLFRKSRQM
jgi:hypothetical protein